MKILTTKLNFLTEKYIGFKEKIQVKGKERNRIIILFLSYLFLLDYIIFSFHTGKNIINIFPSIPVIEDKIEINVFMPSLDGTSLINEKRSIPKIKNKERYVNYLVAQVVKGSIYENTTQAVPIDLFVRKIWITGDGMKNECIIDIVPAFIEDKIKIITGTESLFKDAVIKTLKENMPEINNVIILVRGIPGKNLWDI